MITRVYFLKAMQTNKSNGICHTFRTTTYRSWFTPKLSVVVENFFEDVSKANNLPNDGWVLESFSRVK